MESGHITALPLSEVSAAIHIQPAENGRLNILLPHTYREGIRGTEEETEAKEEEEEKQSKEADGGEEG